MDDTDLLLGELAGKNVPRKLAAIEAIGRLGRDEKNLASLIATLQEKLQKSPVGMKLPFIQALSEIPTDQTSAYMSFLLNDFDPAIRAAAAKSLGAYSQGSKALIHHLREENHPTVIATCLQAFARFPDLEAVPHLVKHLESSNKRIPWHAHDALVNSFGLDQGWRSAAWDSWIKKGDKENDKDRAKVFAAAQAKQKETELSP